MDHLTKGHCSYGSSTYVPTHQQIDFDASRIVSNTWLVTVSISWNISGSSGVVSSSKVDDFQLLANINLHMIS